MTPGSRPGTESDRLCSMPSLEKLQQMLDAEPGDPFLLYAIAQEYQKKGDHERAIETYRACIERDDGQIYAYYHAARSLDAVGRGNEAAALLRSALAHPACRNDPKAREELTALLETLDA